MHTNWIGLYTMVRREVKRTMRVVVQTLVAPVVSAALYIFIFGTVIGSQINDFAGVPYVTFVFPGVLMLSLSMRRFRVHHQHFTLCGLPVVLRKFSLRHSLTLRCS